MNSTEALLTNVLERIDQANLADPNQALFEGELHPKEWIYSQHMTRWLFTLIPEPSELMQIACRAQHLERWKLPRTDYPEGKKGYYQWRQACGVMHGQRAAALMAECGYQAHDCDHVAQVLTKRALQQEPDTQLLEDVACLVFLEKYFSDFYQKNSEYDREKWLRIVRRTWQKMTDRGHQAALPLVHHLPTDLQQLVQEAVS